MVEQQAVGRSLTPLRDDPGARLYRCPRRPWWWWTCVIALGVFLGQVASFGAYQAYLSWEARQVMAAWTAERQRSLAEASEQAKAQARVDAAQAEFERRRGNTRAQLRETCTYWTQVVRTENTALNLGYQQMACERLRKFR